MPQSNDEERPNMEWRLLAEGGASIIINPPMLDIFNQLAQAANAETGDMLIHCLGGLLFEHDDFKKTVHHEH
jgi:hypothetical protein